MFKSFTANPPYLRVLHPWIPPITGSTNSWLNQGILRLGCKWFSTCPPSVTHSIFLSPWTTVSAGKVAGAVEWLRVFFLNAWSKLCLYQTLSLHGKKGHCCSSIITLSFAHWSHSMKSPSWPGNSQSIRYSKEKDVTHLAPPKSLLVFWRVRSILKAQHPSLLLIGSTGPIHSLYYNQHSFLPSPWWITFLASVLRVSKDRRWFTGTVQDILFTLLFCDFSRMMIFGGHWYVSKIHTLYAHRLKELYTSVWNSSLDASMLLSTSENICHCPRICVYSYLRPIFSPYQVDDLVPVSADYGQWSNHLFL